MELGQRLVVHPKETLRRTFFRHLVLQVPHSIFGGELEYFKDIRKSVLRRVLHFARDRQIMIPDSMGREGVDE